MNEFDDDLISGAFGAFRAGAAPAVRAAGPEHVRQVIKHRRKVRITAMALTAVVLIAVPVAAYATFGTPSRSPVPPGASTSATPSPSQSASPSPWPSADHPDHETNGYPNPPTVEELTATSIQLPAWGWNSMGCPTGSVRPVTGTVAETHGKARLVELVQTNLDGDNGVEAAVLLHCQMGEVPTGQVIVFDKDIDGNIILLGQVLVSSDDMNGIWDIQAGPNSKGLVVEVSDIIPCCSTPWSSAKHSLRMLKWDGSKPAFAQPPAYLASTTIPGRLFLGPEQLNGDDLRFQDPAKSDLLPELCGASYASDRNILDRRTMRGLVRERPDSAPHMSVIHSVTTYRPGKAVDFMQQLKNAVSACPTDDGDSYKLKTAGTYGDQTVLVEITRQSRDFEGNPTEGTDTFYISVVRVGDVVAILHTVAWEGGSANRNEVNGFTEYAAEQLTRWLSTES